jgi:hypothetical protein
MKKKTRIRRQIQLKVMLTLDERAHLFKVAGKRGLTASDVVRQWIRETMP